MPSWSNDIWMTASGPLDPEADEEGIWEASERHDGDRPTWGIWDRIPSAVPPYAGIFRTWMGWLEGATTEVKGNAESWSTSRPRNRMQTRRMVH